MRSGAAAGPVLLEDGYLLTLADDGRRGRLSLAVSDGVIAGIGPRAALRSRFPTAGRVSCRGRIVMPGLVNAHLHPDLHVLKGALEELGLHDWGGIGFFEEALTLLGGAAGRELQRAAVRASLAEAALCGTTCVGTYGVSTDADRVCAEALGEIGLRGALTIRDIEFAPAADRGLPADMPVFYRLHAEEALYTPELERAAAAHARGDRMVMHAAETRERIAIARERFGTTTVHLLERHGLLSPRVLLSHAIHLDDAELALIAQRGAQVVVSPAAEMKLGDGLPRVVEMLRSGIPVALGTDAAVCNNGTDLFLEMRALGHSQKLLYGPGALSAEQILLTATRYGAAALGGSERFGCLAEGMAADVIMIDVNNPRLQPLIPDGERSNLAANIVFAATGSDVTDVMVAGRFIVRRRRLLNADAPSLWRAVGAAARTLHGHIPQTT